MNVINNMGITLDELKEILKKYEASVDIYLCDETKSVECFMVASFDRMPKSTFSGGVYSLSAWAPLKEGFLEGYEGYGYVHQYEEGDLETDDCITKIVNVSYDITTGTPWLSLDFNGTGENKNGIHENYNVRHFEQFMRHAMAFPVAIIKALGLFGPLSELENKHVENMLSLVEGHTLAFNVRPIELVNRY